MHNLDRLFIMPFHEVYLLGYFISYYETFEAMGNSQTRRQLKLSLTLSRSSRRRYSVRKGTLRNFTKFTGKHLCQSLCFNKACNFIKIEFMAMVFSCEFCEISMNTFFTEHVWVTASTLSLKRQKSLCKRKL